MDLLTEIFKSIRLEGCIFFNARLTAPWDLPLGPSNRPRFHLVVEGGTWLESSKLLPMHLSKGEAVFLNDEAPHRLANKPMEPGRCNIDLLTGPVTSELECHLICGTFGFDEELKHPLIDTMPTHIRLAIPDDKQSFWAMVRIMVEELDEQHPGSNVVIDKLCELFFIQVLRAHTEDNMIFPSFMAALDDPITSRGLRLIHERPETDWTLDSLARTVGLSRSAFAKRFHQLVGVPPKTYLTTWRMHKAKQLLRNPYARLASVAQQVGYSSEAAFNRAFKQFFGKSPGAFRSEFKFDRDQP